MSPAFRPQTGEEAGLRQLQHESALVVMGGTELELLRSILRQGYGPVRKLHIRADVHFVGWRPSGFRDTPGGMRVGVIFFSGTGTVAALCEAAAAGARNAGCSEVLLHRIVAEDLRQGRFVHRTLLSELVGCAAQIWGTPTYMGGVAAQFKAFADASSELWESRAWQDQLATGITAGGAPNGDQGSALANLSVLAAQHAMLWLGPSALPSTPENPLGCSLGLAAQAAGNRLPADLLLGAERLGARVATLAARLGSRSRPTTRGSIHGEKTRGR